LQLLIVAVIDKDKTHRGHTSIALIYCCIPGRVKIYHKFVLLVLFSSCGM